MKSDQNAGTGATAYGIGSLTANNMSLVNGPTWGAGGLAFVAASSQYGSIADFLGNPTLTVFARIAQTTASSALPRTVWAQDDVNLPRGIYLNQITTGAFRLLRSNDGTVGAGKFEVYDTAAAQGSTSDRTLVSQFVSGGGRSLWYNKTSVSLSLFAGADQTQYHNNSIAFLFGAQLASGSPANFHSMTATALATITGDLTTPQRETLTDMINAL